jgi:hypothetical protein
LTEQTKLKAATDLSSRFFWVARKCLGKPPKIILEMSEIALAVYSSDWPYENRFN